MKQVVLIGGGGHCKSVIDVIEAEKKLQILGILDANLAVGHQVLGHSVLGGDEKISELAQKGTAFIVTVGKLGLSGAREKILQKLEALGAELVTTVSPKAHVSAHARIGVGTVIHHGAIVNANAQIGKNCIVNTMSVIEHDVIVEDNVHLSTMAIVNGHAKIPKNSFLASHSVVNVAVEGKVPFILGANSFLYQNPTSEGLYVGNPAKFKGAHK